ncbi:MAG: plasmid maintenance system killer protein [Candidatus Nitrohelix vancouverensis]|uniref:Plasmid maintenance system killer protein n=1 Tax=Candidatus Nitrohelix vancouverensis TaxID=2705534 RepID=A0A7T0G361_9BACT|nr:MAG: plasmid maintenance system killer protein [Candidatus Nitrohelix vancouverensis]
MIESFRHRGLKRLYEKGDKSKLRSDMAEKAELFLSVLDTAETLDELKISGFGFHPLKGNMRDFHSVSVSRNHRIIFRFEDGKAFDIDLVDYH